MPKMGMNGQIHLTLETDHLNSLRKEAEGLEISVSELIRRKSSLPPVEEELIILRKLKKRLLKEQNG
jgi:hypothetical protein